MIKIIYDDIYGIRESVKFLRDNLYNEEKSDSFSCNEYYNYDCGSCFQCPIRDNCDAIDEFHLGEKDLSLIKHPFNISKSTMLISSSFEVKAPLWWWMQFSNDNSIGASLDLIIKSKIKQSEFNMNDFDTLDKDSDNKNLIITYLVQTLNVLRHLYLCTGEELYYNQILESIPLSYILKKKVCYNYNNLYHLYYRYRDSNVKEWKSFCSFCTELPYFNKIFDIKNEV